MNIFYVLQVFVVRSLSHAEKKMPDDAQRTHDALPSYQDALKERRRAQNHPISRSQNNIPAPATSSQSSGSNADARKSAWRRIKQALKSKGILPSDEESQQRLRQNMKYIGTVVVAGLVYALFVVALVSLIILI